jgi:leucyl/phenylalanyl-tRNA---protein transferase
MHILSEKLTFPPPHTANKEGILAIGGDLSVARLQLAYSSGIFPWFNEDEPIIWHSPDPRFVLFPEKLIVKKQVQKTIDSKRFAFTRNLAFADVIRACKTTPRKGQDGTWITPEMEQAYLQLHERGVAQSAEAWLNGKLVGGLYGVRVGRVFCGESMFSHESNASRVAFVCLVKAMQHEGITLIDCQAHTPYLESFGAEFISRNRFLTYLAS